MGSTMLQRSKARAKLLAARATNFLEGWPPSAVLLDMARNIGEHRAGDLAASIAYYALFSLFPLLLGLIALLSLFLDPNLVREELIQMTSQYLPGTEEIVTANIESIVRFRGALGIISIAGLLWSGSAVFGALGRALNRAWGIHTVQPFFVSWAKRMVLALGVGALFVFSLSTSTLVYLADAIPLMGDGALDVLRTLLVRGGLQAGSILTSLAIIGLLYQFSTSSHIPWRDLWAGVVGAGVLFELAKNVFIFYLAQIASFQQVYGSVSSVIALLLWIYVSSLILILGAEFGASVGRWRQGKL